MPEYILRARGKCATIATVYAGVVELVDSMDLGSIADRRAGSSPAARTKQNFRPGSGIFDKTRDGGGEMKRVVSIQDISCLGRCSLTVALPVISAMGVECAIVPTAVLSTHTAFPGFTCKDLTDQLAPIARHWRSQGVTFDAVSTGYIASAPQVQQVLDFAAAIRSPETLLVVDPAMADHGKLYAGFEGSFPKAMARVVAQADVALPNLTEACLLTDTPYREEADEAFARELLKNVAALGAKRVVLTGVSFEPETLGAMGYDSADGTFFTCLGARQPGSFHGTGDIFSAAVVGALVRGMTLREAVSLAVDFTLKCIQATERDPAAGWYGVEFEKALPDLVRRMEQWKK